MGALITFEGMVSLIGGGRVPIGHAGDSAFGGGAKELEELASRG